MKQKSARGIMEGTWPRALALIVVSLWLIGGSAKVRAADLEAGAFPEFDIWITLDEKNRLFILNSYAEEPNFAYNEAALGISWDSRFHENWSWRAGVRRIDKDVFPPDKNENRAVYDLKYFYPLENDFLLTNRNRLDVRDIEGSTSFSYRYRNRTQLEWPLLTAFEKDITAFASYEIYYDSRYRRMGQRHRFIGGVSIPMKEWMSVDVFYGYHIETAPKRETGGAIGLAIGFYF